MQFIVNCTRRHLKVHFFIIPDKNECTDGTSKCPAGCKNTVGGYDCLCPKGYVGNADKTACVGKCQFETMKKYICDRGYTWE